MSLLLGQPVARAAILQHLGKDPTADQKAQASCLPHHPSLMVKDGVTLHTVPTPAQASPAQATPAQATPATG